MSARERAALDRHITGNYGEDEFREEPKMMPPDARRALEEYFAAKDKPSSGTDIVQVECSMEWNSWRRIVYWTRSGAEFDVLVSEGFAELLYDALQALGVNIVKESEGYWLAS